MISRGHLRPAARVASSTSCAEQVEDHAPLLGIVRFVERRNLAGLLELGALVHEQRRVAAVVEQHVRAAAVGPHQRLLRAPPVLLERLALPGEHRHAVRLVDRALAADRDRGGGVVLRREDVARHPAHVGAEVDERLDEHRRLHGHVQRAHDPRALERILALVLLADRHQAGHLLLGETDLLAAEFGERKIGHLERRTIGGSVGVSINSATPMCDVLM